MSNEQNMPDLVQRANDYLDTDWTAHPDKRALRLIEALVNTLTAAQKAGGETLASLLEVESEYQNLKQKYAALVEAAEAAIEMAKTAERNVSNSNLGMGGAAGDCREIYSGLSLALAQQDQPAGEWITINEDGSNLPEYVEWAEWGLWREHADEETWRDWHPEDWNYISRHDNSRKGPVVAFWSIPDIEQRPRIPKYTARKTGT